MTTTSLISAADVLVAIAPIDPDHLTRDTAGGCWQATWGEFGPGDATDLTVESLRRTPGITIVGIFASPFGRTITFRYDPQAAAADPANAAGHTASAGH